jgi:hypothetical protein
MDHVDVCGGQSTMNQEAQELLENDVDRGGRFYEWPIAHEQCAKDLQRGNFKWEIKWRHHNHRTIGPAVATRFLPGTVTGIRKASRKKANAISGEVLQKRASYGDFCHALIPTLWHDTLYELREEVRNILLGKKGRGFGTDSA